MLDRRAPAAESARRQWGEYSVQPRDIIAAVPFLVGALDFRQMEALAAKVDAPRQFARGAVLMRQGDIGQSMFLIADGKVAVAVHSPEGEQRVAMLGPGDIVGEMSLLTGARRSATVTAIRRVAAVEIARPAIEALIVDTPGLIARFAEMMEQRNAELKRIHDDAQRWNDLGLARAEIAARMTAYFAG